MTDRAVDKQHNDEENQINKILEIIHQELSGLEIEGSTEQYLQELVTAGIQKARISGVNSLRMLETVDNYRIFAEQIRAGIGDGGKKITNETVERALGEICPLYPIC